MDFIILHKNVKSFFVSECEFMTCANWRIKLAYNKTSVILIIAIMISNLAGKDTVDLW